MTEAERHQTCALPRALPLWEQVVRRMLAEGVNFDKPREGMAILREVLGESENAREPYWVKCLRCGQEFDAPGLLTAHTKGEHPEGVPPDDFMQVPDDARRTT